MEAVKTPQEKPAQNAAAKPAEKAAQKQVKDLAEQIQFYNRMAQLARTRARFVQTLDELEALDFKNAQELESFENSEKFKLILKKDYNTEVLSVSNDFILHEFKQFMLVRIKDKIGAIDREFLA